MQKLNQLKVFTVVFCAFLVIPLTVSAAEQVLSPTSPVGVMAQKLKVGASSQARVERLTQLLGLTAPQQEQLLKIYHQWQEDAGAIRAKTPGQGGLNNEALKNLSTQYKAKVAAVLTSEQQQKLEEMRKKGQVMARQGRMVGQK